MCWPLSSWSWRLRVNSLSGGNDGGTSAALFSHPHLIWGWGGINYIFKGSIILSHQYHHHNNNGTVVCIYLVHFPKQGYKVFYKK